jgi:hypothetical protein
MKRDSITASVVVMIVRMKPLPRRHRIAHLRALVARQATRSTRRQELVALLRDELSARLEQEDRTA